MSESRRRSASPAVVALARLLRTLALALLVLIAGCARLALMYSSDPLADFEQARAEQDYDRAVYIAEHLGADEQGHDEIQSRLPALREEIEQFERETIARAEEFADQERWEKVWQSLDEAMNQWRASPTLREARQRLREREERESRILQSKILIAEARWRLSTAALANRLAHFTHSPANRLRDHWRDRNRELADELVELGRWFAEEQDWHRANRCLKNGQALDPDAPPESLLAKVDEKVSAASRRTRASEARARRRQAQEKQQHARALLEQYLDSGELSKLLELRRYLRQHDHVDFSEELTAKIEIISRERFRAGMSEGNARYAQGEYRAARSVWRRIEPLAPPESDLSKKLERVQRVIDKLENLESD